MIRFYASSYHAGVIQVQLSCFLLELLYFNPVLYGNSISRVGRTAFLYSMHTVTTFMKTSVNHKFCMWRNINSLFSHGALGAFRPLKYLALSGWEIKCWPWVWGFFWKSLKGTFLPWEIWKRFFCCKQFPVEVLLASLHWDVHSEPHPKERLFCWAEQCGHTGEQDQLPRAG